MAVEQKAMTASCAKQTQAMKTENFRFGTSSAHCKVVAETWRLGGKLPVPPGDIAKAMPPIGASVCAKLRCLDSEERSDSGLSVDGSESGRRLVGEPNGAA